MVLILLFSGMPWDMVIAIILFAIALPACLALESWRLSKIINDAPEKIAQWVAQSNWVLLKCELYNGEGSFENRLSFNTWRIHTSFRIVVRDSVGREYIGWVKFYPNWLNLSGEQFEVVWEKEENTAKGKSV